MIDDFNKFLTSKFDLQIERTVSIDTEIKLPKAYRRLYDVVPSRIGLLDVYCIQPKATTFSVDDCGMLISLVAHLYPVRTCLLTRSITDKAKQTLVAKRINYLALNSDIYLPDLLSIYEKSKFKDKSAPSSERKLTEKLSPLSTKIAILYIQRIVERRFNAKIIQQHTQASLPAIATATDSLIEKNLLSGEKVGRTWQYTFEVTAKELWSLRKALFSELIRSRRVINVNDSFFKERPLVLSGESAVAQYSLLSDPTTPIYGLDAKRVEHFELNYRDDASNETIIIEIFYYHPLSKTISFHQVIDRIELVISKPTGLPPRVTAAYEEVEDEIMEKLNSYG